MSASKQRALESRALDAERNVAANGQSNAALNAAISSAELYMQALKLAESPSERKRLDGKCKELLIKAELIKSAQDGKKVGSQLSARTEARQPASTRKFTTRENIIVLEGSKLNNAVFKPWTQKPSAADFDLKPGENQYLELPALPLSDAQQESFAGWCRPHEALQKIQLYQDGNLLPNQPTMVRNGRIDLVQDMTSDCSVVASLCAGTARAEKGHPKILRAIVYPYDHDGDAILVSPNGKYVLRLYFNGCWRRVEIDDMLPTSSTSRVLHVIDRSCPGLLWPALVEKAYLKVRGGYDFPGSNSGTDLAVLTGWIPQQVFLHDEDVDSDSLWSELYNVYEAGDVLLTIGTGKLPRREQRQLGLAAEHDYAVLDMKANGEHREILIKNPWSDGDVWKGAVKRRPNPNHQDDGNTSTQQQSAEEEPEMMPGTFWMDFSSVFQYFENMYVNWNPSRFSHRQDLHFSWHTSDAILVPNVHISNPQFSIRTSNTGEIWLLLNRHFRTGDYAQSSSGKSGYISLYLFDKSGYRVLSSEGALIRGPFVDSPNTLLRFEASAGDSYTVVIVSQDLPEGKHNFTLSSFAHGEISLEDSPSRYQHHTSIASAWTKDSAGGNSDSAKYLSNPQFNMSFVSSAKVPLALALQVADDPTCSTIDATSIHVKLLILSNPSGKRITRLRPRDIVASSGDYRRGSAVIETILPYGRYTAIASTFNENRFAKFSLDCHHDGTQPAQLTLVPSERSGRLGMIAPPLRFDAGVSKMIASVSFDRITRAILIAQLTRLSSKQKLESVPPASSSRLYKLSLEQGQGPYRVNIASSSSNDTEFVNIATGLRIDDQDLHPRLADPKNGGLWLVVERPLQAAGNSESDAQAIEVEILAEERISIGTWQAVSE